MRERVGEGTRSRDFETLSTATSERDVRERAIRDTSASKFIVNPLQAKIRYN